MPVSTQSIANKIRSLRTERRWTQAELASKLGLSQSRLSELERGDGSFTAEQFIEVLRLFNVTVRDFDPISPRASRDDLQQALARHGAKHLLEPDTIVPTEELASIHRVVVDTIATPSPRHLAALSPVIVANIDRISLPAIALELDRVGLLRRFAWVLENTQAALQPFVESTHRGVGNRARRARIVIDQFLRSVTPPPPHPPDIVDTSIRTEKTIDHLKASEPSRTWAVISALQPSDFTDALEQSHVFDP